MAESVLKKFEEHVQCVICLETYKDPKVLQCHHVFCSSCLSKIFINKQNSQQLLQFLDCPTCRKQTPLLSGNVEQLQSAFHMSSLLDIQNEFSKVEDLSISLEQTESDHPKAVKLSVSAVCFCSDHEGEEVKLYCESCAVTICFLCAISGGSHVSHQYITLSEAYKKYEKFFETSLESLDSRLKSITNLVSQVDVDCNGVREREATLKKDIGEKFQELHDILNARQTELVDNLQEVVQRKLKMLSAHRDELEIIQAKVSRCVDVIRENVATKNEGKLLKMKADISKQAEEISNPLQPTSQKFGIRTGELVFKPSSDFYVACQKFGEVDIAGSPDPLKCHATAVDGSLDVVEVGEESVIRVHAVDSGGDPCMEDISSSFTCELLSDEPEPCAMTSCTGRVERVGQNEYEVSYLPASSGSFMVHVKICGEHIKGSPFPVRASETKSDWTMKDIKGVQGIAVCHGSHEVVVTKTGKPCVTVYSSSGDEVYSFGMPGFGQEYLNHPYGVTIDDKGKLIIADYFNNRIQKFSLKGEFIASVGTKGTGPLKFTCLYDVAFNRINKKLYIIDSACVQVLKSDFSYFASFGKVGHRDGEFQSPRGIACDKVGMVYVADSGNNRIQVFTSGGKFLLAFGKRGSLEGELAMPVAIAISLDGLVYVCENENRRISIFTRTGKFSYFLKGRNDETFHKFVSPHDIAVDEDGVCYICDSNCVVKI